MNFLRFNFIVPTNFSLMSESILFGTWSKFSEAFVGCFLLQGEKYYYDLYNYLSSCWQILLWWNFDVLIRQKYVNENTIATRIFLVPLFIHNCQSPWREDLYKDPFKEGMSIGHYAKSLSIYDFRLPKLWKGHISLCLRWNLQGHQINTTSFLPFHIGIKKCFYDPP